MAEGAGKKRRQRHGGNRSQGRRGASGGRRGGSASHARHAATPARLLALEVTRERRERDAYVRELIDSRRAESALPPEEFAYAQVLAFGATMCEGTLDEAIDRSLNSPHDVKPKVRDALRISAYELLFLKKPAHVVVDQGVELVRSTARKAAGLANAVLHKMVRDAEGFPWGDPAHDAGAFARLYGVPAWLASALEAQYGHAEAARILQASLEAAPTYLVDNPYNPGEQFASDLSAQRVAALVPLPDGAGVGTPDAPDGAGGAILEIGAGRGTKTMLLQRRALLETGHAARIHTVDVHAYKADLLRERLDASRVPGVTAHVGDARDLDAIPGLPSEFPTVFVDAPCSGTGTLRRHPEIRWHMTPAGVEDLAELQRAMLASAAARVASGGTLVYATCSILARENERNIEDFLKTEIGSKFDIVPISDASRRENGFPADCQQGPFFQSTPSSGGPDGHFAAILRRVR